MVWHEFCNVIKCIYFTNSKQLHIMLQAIIQAAADMLASGIQPQEIVTTLVSGGITPENATNLVIGLIMSA